MATLVIYGFLCVVGVAVAAPQDVQPRRQAPVAPAVLQPQLVQDGAYYQPPIVRAPYSRRRLVQSLPYARQVALQYAQPSPSVFLTAEPTAAVTAAPVAAVRPAALAPLRPAVTQPLVRQGLVSGVPGRTIAILRQSQDIGVDGSYTYGFESEDGTVVETSAGPLNIIGPEEGVQTVTGSFTYIAPDGTPITTNWVADENGFRAEGAHLPRGPLNP